MPMDRIEKPVGATGWPLAASGGLPSSRSPSPTFTRADRQQDYSDSEDDDPAAPTLTLYRAYEDGHDRPVDYRMLSPFGRSLVDEKGLSTPEAFRRARESAKDIIDEPAILVRTLRDHARDSNYPVFPVRDDVRGPSPFTSLSRHAQTAASFHTRPFNVGPDTPAPRVMVIKVKESKVIRNTENPAEYEYLAPGGIKPRHFVRWETVSRDPRLVVDDRGASHS